MCGILGHFSKNDNPIDVNLYCRLTNLLTHRGPDDGAYWFEPPFFLGHRRLAIIDLEHGTQPMVSMDAHFVVVFNGEIYNYIELRQELLALGYKFRTNSDTEVLLNGYAAWGFTLPEKLIGMFAFAIVDRQEKTLFLARDRFGEKPLFYYDTPQGITFASELKALTALPNLPKNFDELALTQYLCLNYVPGNQTLLKSIQRLAPGSWHFYTQNKSIVQRYWQPQKISTQQKNLNKADVLQQLKEKLDHSVNLCLRSDVPVTLFLSGGIDSSLVAESAMRQGKLKDAYCLDFEERSFSEWHNAQTVASKLKLNLHRVVLQPSMLENFFQIAQQCDDPLADSSALAVWTLSQSVAKDFKVVISGDGGDELFGGYETYKASLLHQKLISLLPLLLRKPLAQLSQMLPMSTNKVSTSYKLMRFLRALDLPTSQAHFTWNGSWLPNQVEQIVTPEVLKDAAINALAALATRHELNGTVTTLNLQSIDAQEYLTNDILVKVDRMAMAHGLETRAPLLNHELAEFAFSLDDSFKFNLFSKPKLLLRSYANEIYGTALSRAKKQGFSIPIHAWLRGPAKHLVYDLLSEISLKNLGFLDVKQVIHLRDLHMSGKKLLGFELWGLMVLVAWVHATISSSATTQLPANLRQIKI